MQSLQPCLAQAKHMLVKQGALLVAYHAQLGS